MHPKLQSFLEAAEENFRSQKLEEAIKQAKMARDCIDQVLITYHVHMASQRKINGVRDWYAVLGIQDCNADVQAIKQAFKKRALKVHPDKNSSDAAEGASKLVSEAWEVLSEPSSRQAYDQIRGSTPPWKQHEYDEQDETASKSSQGPVATSELASPNSESGAGVQSNTSAGWASGLGISGFGVGTAEQYGTTTASHDQAPFHNSAAAGSTNWNGTWTTSYNQFPFPGPWWSVYNDNNNNLVPPIYGGAAGSSGATTINQATPKAGSWANRIRYLYGQGPSNFGTAGGTGGSSTGASSGTRVITPPASVLMTGLCHYCNTGLISTPAGTRWVISCTRCNWSFPL